MAARPAVPVTGQIDQRAGRAVIQRCGTHPCAGGCAGHDDAKPDRLQFAGHDSQPEVPAAVSDVLRTPGMPLDAVTQSAAMAFFGHSFAGVRVHSDPAAATTADAVAARAYTVGSHIVFAPGQYAPGTASGSQLLTHELTHVVQQSGTVGCAAALQPISHPSDPAETEAERVAAEFAASATAQPGIHEARQVMQRQLIGEPPGGTQYDPMDDPRMHPGGAPHAAHCGRPDWCPPGFCEPYSSESYARYQLVKMMPILLAGIAVAVDSRVVPLWRDHLLGGSPPRDLTGTFAADFQRSRTTAKTTGFLVDALRRNLAATPPTFPAGATSVALSLSSLITPELAMIGDPASPNRMNFDIPGEVPGNIAGDIGTDQLACKAGAMPSPFNDERTADGTVTVSQDAVGNLLVQPVINYVVRDTIDLCPGDCGTALEQFATVPISQFEATGISGDVPFTVRYAVTPASFSIPKAGGPPASAPAAPPPTPTAAPAAPPPTPTAVPADTSDSRRP
jgi:hypothetical protein